MIAPALRSAEIERSIRKPTENLSAYDPFLRACRLHFFRVEQNNEALRLLYRAIDLNSSYGAAYGLAAFCICWQRVFSWLPPAHTGIAEGVRLAHLAIETGKNDSEALWTAAHSLVFLDGDLELALTSVQRSVALNPSSPNAWWVSGIIHIYLHDPETALEHLTRARRLNPFERLYHSYWMATALAHFFAGRYEDAADSADKSLAEYGEFVPALRIKIVSCGLLGRIEEGRACVRRLLAVMPGTSVAATRTFFGYLQHRNPRAFENYFEGLRLCGLPEI